MKFAFPLLVVIAVLSPTAQGGSEPKALPSESLHNLFQVDGQMFSGSSPDDEAGFQELARLGVKSIISVDGSKPNVELAKKHGMRYVHLPIGYDGVPKDRVAQLIKAASSAEGAVYLHCHHGKHRGPAAVAVVCEGLKGWTPGQATEWLKTAGTADDYAGLYRDVRNFEKPDAATLAALPDVLPEVSPTPPLVDVMVSIDERFDLLKADQKAGWKTPPGQADGSPVQHATLLWEHYRELARIEDTAKRPDDYRAKLSESEAAADSLRAGLRAPVLDISALDAAFKKVGQGCASCHKAYRNKK